MRASYLQKTSAEKLREKEWLLQCVHCGLCVGVCPTYQFSGNENNSPRGRLAIWRAISEGRLHIDEKTDFYLQECVGCLACETACPANVPYGNLINKIKSERVGGDMDVSTAIRLLSVLIPYTRIFQWFCLPVRLLRRIGWSGQRFFFPGNPAVCQSTAAYAGELVQKYRPSGKEAFLFTGCVMEAVFREINFAAVRVLSVNGIRICVPKDQVCCGAVLEHSGMPGKEELDRRNHEAFNDRKTILTNSSGCSLSLKEGLDRTVLDTVHFLNTIGLRKGTKLETEMIFLDVPCHLYHGQKVRNLPEKVFEAIGNPWMPAPDCEACCGSGGIYNLTHPDNAREIIERKSEFLNKVPFEKCIVATTNHVCMTQWHSVLQSGKIKKRVSVRHVVQLLDESYRRAGIYTH
jgi:glycolate oxidase iron-sulfur subunit